MTIETHKLFLFMLLVVANGIDMITGQIDAPIFIFGDSTADVGTNNHLKTLVAAKANHRYHGIDFPFSKPTGRFSNGKNAADQIASLLVNYKLSPPPFLSLLTRKSTFKRNLLRGANFASGGSGVFKTTGHEEFHRVICMEEQIKQFSTVRENITELLGSPKAAEDLLRNSIYIISIGSNDIVEYTAAHIYQPGDPKQFMANLTQAYATHLVNLYELGARKFAIVGIPPLGCCPAARVYNTSTGGCVEVLNESARLFYKLMELILTELSLMFRGFKYSLGNTYAMTMNVIDNPRANGFKEVIAACCGNGTAICEVGVNLCSNRGGFLFWDLFHPTEKASELAALTLVYGEGPEYVTPMNFSSLAMLHEP